MKPAVAALLFVYVAIPVGAARAEEEAFVPGEPSEARAKGEAPAEVESREATVEIVVQGAPPARPVVEASITGERARTQAGTQDDAIKAVQNLPGFARGGASSELVAWGAAPQDSRILIDGVEIPRLYHGSALRSVFPSERVESLSATPGAYDARFGRGIGGIVRVTTKPPDLIDRRLVASADLLDASVLGSSPLWHGGAASASARYGYVDRWLPKLVDNELQGSLYAIPSYWDAQAELSTRAGDDANLRVVALTASDATTNTLPSSDPARVRSEQRRTSFGRLYVQYTARLEDGSETRVTPFVGWDSSRLISSAGATRTGLEIDSFRYGLRASVRSRPKKAFVYELGLDFDGNSASVTRLGSLAIPRREGDPFPFGTIPVGGIVDDPYRANTTAIGPYAATEIELGPLSVEPALRLETFLSEASRSRPSVNGVPDVGVATMKALLEPRLALLYRLSRRATLYAALGRYHQLPRVEDLGAYAGNPLLEAASAWHYSLGERVELWDGIRLEVRGFYRTAQDVTRRNPEPVPRLSQTLLSDGRARAYGSELSLRARELFGFEGWAILSLVRSEVAVRDRGYRLSDWDSPVTFTLLASRALGAWLFSGRARLASGNPRTPIEGVLYDVSDGNAVPLYGALNSTRLPAFFQLDLRVDRALELGRGLTLHAYLDLLNVTGRRNPEEIAYSTDYSEHAYITGLPPLAVLGVRLEL